MSDIFLNYAIEEREKAEKLAAFFEQEGWTVWWEIYKNPGANYTRIVLDELDSAGVVVTLWSRTAHTSTFVLDLLDLMGGKPVLVLLENVTPPLFLRNANSFRLSDWDGVSSHAGLTMLLRYLHSLIDASLLPARPQPSASFEELSLSKIQENARLGIKESTAARPEGDHRFKGVFISYRRNEAAAYAGRLYDRLAARFGKEKVFIDTENVAWGEDFVEAITLAAETCAVMIALISPRWTRDADAELDDYVRLEVSKALGRKIRVVPILIQGASMPAPKELPEDLAPLVRRNALALSDTRWERDVEDLMKSLENLLEESGGSSGEVWRVF